MITALKGTVVTLLIGSLTVAPLRAQSAEGKWDNLKQIKPDQEIEIVTNDAKAYRGRMQSLRGDSMKVRLRSGDQTFERSNILRVAYKPKGRLHHIKKGAAIGAGVGLLNGVFSDRCNSEHVCMSTGKAISVSIAVSGSIGAAIGAALPAGSWEVVYRSP
jgi:hypothetical protein